MKKKSPMRDRLEKYKELLAEIRIEEQRAKAITEDDSLTARRAKAGIKDHLRELLEREQTEYEQLTAVINALPCAEQRQVLLARYMDEQKWPIITALIFGKKEDYTERQDSYKRQIYRIHGYALANANRIITRAKQ